MTIKVKKPVNQASLYHTYSDLYEKLMNNEITESKCEAAVKCLNGMNSTFALELKLAEVQRATNEFTPAKIRQIELKNADTVLDEHKE